MIHFDFYKYYYRICRYYNRAKVEFFYKFLLQKCGKNVEIISPLYITPSNIVIKDNVSIWAGCRIEGISEYLQSYYNPLIVINSYVCIQQNLHLTCAESINIGEYTSIGANVTITDINHPYEDIGVAPDQQKLSISPVFIGNDCKIYNNVVILPGTRIGKHCIIGANSVVSGIFPNFCVIVGAPARIVKKYNQETNQWERL